MRADELALDKPETSQPHELLLVARAVVSLSDQIDFLVVE